MTGSHEDRPVVAVIGELDATQVPHLYATLLAALESSSGLDLDLSAVSACDRAGLHLLLAVHRHAVADGKPFALISSSRAVRLVAWLAHAGHLLGAPTRAGVARA
ncbi:STAS domain-containing protein [Streptomyces sp. TRM76323]|uniref:STAS domain-containing protein n=1 Tax=Streptomyces tamarix TaxID=3078565 RepID=A0ABU3QI14_9ACTN|nr:STAS domain-containing protein [Streptomyces tamarix]MDT9682374.1 STAS domain-containing protein [Streptomyces tamarix]